MKLTKELCLIGADKSLQNADSLTENSLLLLSRGSFGHSLALSVLAIEECGKAFLLIAVHEDKTKLDEELLKAIFRNHTFKVYVPLLELALSEGFPKDDLEYVKSLAPTLDKVKQRGLYVDFLEGKWVTPQDSDLDEIARTNLDYAKRIYKSVKAYRNNHTNVHL